MANIHMILKLFGEHRLKTATKQSIIEELRQAGPGSSGFVSLSWKPEYGNEEPGKPNGHVFYVENVEDEIVFVDPQDGLIHVDDYFAKAVAESIEFMRVDHLKPDWDIIEEHDYITLHRNEVVNNHYDRWFLPRRPQASAAWTSVDVSGPASAIV